MREQKFQPRVYDRPCEPSQPHPNRLDRDGLNLQTDERGVENGFVPAEVTIRDPPTQEWSNVGPEIIEVTDRKGGLYTTSESAGDTVGSVVGGDSAGGRTRWKPSANVISPHGARGCNPSVSCGDLNCPRSDTMLTIVCPSLSKLDNHYQESSEGDGIGKMTKSGQLFVSNALGTFNKGSVGDTCMA